MDKRPLRIFQIAKELNISHTEILSFLASQGIETPSHMSPVDEQAHQMILTEFSKDKEIVDRFRKEQVRREIHDTRLKERQESDKKLKLLTLDEQRRIEEQERELELKKAEEEKLRLEEEEKRRQEEVELKKKEAEKKKAQEKEQKKEETPKKRKLRKVNLSEIESQIGLTSKRGRGKKEIKKEEPVQKSVKDAVRQTLAKIETKTRKKSYKKDRSSREQEEVEGDIQAIQIAEYASVDELAKIFSIAPSDVIQKCLGLGVLATINQRLEWDLIELLAEEYGFAAEKLTDVGEELFSFEETEEDLEQAEPRAPVVTVMGHVDHGKTSLLDYIRKTNVVAGESGGITQHIGAYRVELPDGKSITFLDTPGHEAFTAMRARGAQVTDIVVLVVAANDSVMPQTIEAINHARAAGVPVVVAINKIDLPGIDIDKVKRELSDNGILVEDWGGKVQCVSLSAKTGDGVSDLMNAMLMEAEMLELKANRNTLGRATVIDSRLDKGHGPVATILIHKGTLKVGDPFICNDYSGKVRAIMNERGQRIRSSGPSDAVEVLGFDHVPQAADIFSVVEDERELKRITSERQRMRREIDHKKMAFSLDTMSSMIREGSIRNLPLIIKGDVDGSIEALAENLEKLNTEEVGVKIIHKAVGMVTESDVLLAEASQAVIIGFQVQVSSNAKLQAKQAGVDVRSYSVIYNTVEEIRLALEGLLEPDKIEKIQGRAVVQTQFKIPKIGFIAGVKVQEGVIRRQDLARLIRDDEVFAESTIESLKRFKDDVKEVKEGLECGIGLEGVKKYMENDIIEAYEIKTVKRKLAAN